MAGVKDVNWEVVVGLVAILLALPAAYYAAQAARYARQTVLVGALETELRRFDEAEDRLNRLYGRVIDFSLDLDSIESPDFRKYTTPEYMEWIASFTRLPARTREALFVGDHCDPTNAGIPFTPAEGWNLESFFELRRSVNEAHVRTSNALQAERRRVEDRREAILTKIAA